MEKSFAIPISRRSFMKLVGLAAAGTVLRINDDGAKAAAAPSMINKVDFSGVELPVLFDADVCVVGGGAAGTAAAVCAARKGAKVVLVERGISLGGLATQGCVFPCMATRSYDSDTPYIKDLNKRMESQGAPTLLGIDTSGYFGGGRGQYVPEYLTYVYDEMCKEAGVDILYNTSLVGAITSEGKIVSCVIQTIEGLAKIQAKIFIDGTGDALLSRFADVPVEKGSEKTGRNQPMSLRFEMGGIDLDRVYNAFVVKGVKEKDAFHEIAEEAIKKKKPPFVQFWKDENNEKVFQSGVGRGELTEDDILFIQAFSMIGKPSVMSMNCPEMPPLLFSSTDAISYSKSVSFGREMMRRLADFFVKNVPGFEKAYISREASMVGVRESWRIRGKYYMDVEDYIKGHHFPDAVCRTAYPVDIHGLNAEFSEKLKKGDYYEIPYRALVTNEISNLLVVGRCASGSFAAQASFRIQPTCMSMGEAAGIAAAWGLSRGIPVNEIKWEEMPEEMRSYVSK